MKLPLFCLLCVLTLLLSPATSKIVSAQTLPEIGSYSADALYARLSALKDQYRINLSDVEKIRVTQRCDTAQNGLRAIAKRAAMTKTARNETYSSVIASLTGLRALVVAKQIDPSNIELLIVEYQQKKAQFDTDLNAYQIALEDSIQVDCKDKPEEFRAALEGVRAARKQVVGSSAEIREATRSNLKTAFDTLKTRIANEEAKDGK